eukprot:6177956-Pleurochrysis_carterae.AAC.1
MDRVYCYPLRIYESYPSKPTHCAITMDRVDPMRFASVLVFLHASFASQALAYRRDLWPGPIAAVEGTLTAAPAGPPRAA